MTGPLLWSPCAAATSFFIQEVVRLYTGLPQNGPQRAFGHVSGVVLNGSVTVGLGIVPDLMTSGRLAVESKTKRFEALDDLAIAKTGKASHVRR
jgi:hypothetical protein